MADTGAEDWFPVLEGPYFDFDNESDEDPELTGVPAAFVARLRDMIPTWRSLGLTDDDTVGCFEDGRLRIGVDIGDVEAKSSVGFLRVEVSDHNWQGGWVSPSRGITQATMAEANPKDPDGGPITDVEEGVDAAVRWTEKQLRRPIRRYLWRDEGRVVASSWRLEDSGRELVVSGAPQLRRDTSPTESTLVRG